MKSLITAILVIQGFAVIAMGFYVFNLQSQIDELHMLLPLDQEPVFGSQSARPSELEKEAMIERINARIDNLADTVEWLASASHASPSPASSEAPLDPGSGNSEPESNAAENRQSTAVAATSSLDTADRSHDSLEPSKTQIRKLSEKHESKAGKPGASKKSKTPSKNSVKENAASSGIAKSTAKHRAEAKGREKRQSSGGDWSVNLMSFPDEAVAKKQVENMSRKGISAAIQRTNISGKNWYRVRIPGFKSKQEAQDYSESVVRKLGLSGTWVSR